MYNTFDIFDNTYDGIKVKCFNNCLRFFKKGDTVPIDEAGLPKDCIIATKYFLDEKEDKQKYVYILIVEGKYVNWFLNLEKIKGEYPIYEDLEDGQISSKYGWNIAKLKK